MPVGASSVSLILEINPSAFARLSAVFAQPLTEAASKLRYNDDNSLSDCEVKTVTAEPDAEHHVPVSPTGKYKIMLWSGLDTMRPIWICKG